MPKKVRCKNGHFYDASVFSSCPHCEKGLEVRENSVDYKKQVSRYAMEYLRGKQMLQGNRGMEVTVCEQKDENLTVGFSHSQEGYFVTGWLVCVSGFDVGHSFGLYYGYNTIGRDDENAICLIGDAEVARKVHCSIVYEDRKNRFFIVPESSYPTYLNGKVLEKFANVQTGDIIQVGRTQFEFVAFCRGNRKWDKKDLQERNLQG